MPRTHITRVRTKGRLAGMYTHTTVHRQICSRFWSGISGAARPSKSNLRDPSSKNAWLQPLRFVYSRAAAVAGPFGRDVIVVVGFTVLARTQGRTVPRSGGRGPAMWGGHQSTWAFVCIYPSLLGESEALSKAAVFLFCILTLFPKKISAFRPCTTQCRFLTFCSASYLVAPR